jgi:ubiquinone/menaquinone biosynthesis C-methylase UbiE/uncharacterized protein YbaR (Trm112 family)
MSRSLLKLLACPSCGNSELEYIVSDESVDNVSSQLADVALLICSSCDQWYPIENRIVCLLPDRLRVRSADEAFIDKHGAFFGVSICKHLSAVNATRSYSSDASEFFSYFDVPIRIAKDRTKNKNHQLKFEEILRGIGAIENGICLELACGNGTHASSLLEVYPDASYVGVDIAPMRLRETRQRLGDYRNILLVQATLDVLPFRDNTFSAVYMVSALQYLEDPEIGLNEARRVLADDGSFVSLDYNPQCYASALGLIQKKQEYDTQLDQCLYEKMSKENLGKWMSGSGFSDIKIRNLLFLPGNLPLPVVVYRIINGILERIPFIKHFSIMLASYSRKRGCGN